jgi:hypothetical protein
MSQLITDKKTYLKTLLENSPSLKSLPEEARRIQIMAILKGNPEELERFIMIFEEENSAMQKIDNDFLKQSKEIEHLVAEAKQLEINANKEIRNEKEEKVTIEEEKTANALLNQITKMKNS